MSSNDVVARARRAAFAHTMADGLTDVFAGFMLFIAAAVIGNSALLALIGLWVLVAPQAIRQLKARHVYPRVGYAKVASESPPERQALGMMIYVAVVIAVCGLLMLFSGRLSDATMWRKWAPLLAAVLIAPGIHFAATRSGFIRYHVLQVVSLGLGLAVAIITTGADYRGVEGYCGLLGLAWLIMGGVVFARFVRANPMHTGAEAVDVE